MKSILNLLDILKARNGIEFSKMFIQLQAYVHMSL